MLDWLIDVVIFAVVAGFAVYLIYTIFFSGSDIARRELRKSTMYRGFDRRSTERTDRRKKNIGPPPGVPERRQGPRRADD